MGLEFIDDTVSGGLRIARRTVACEVCKTIFLTAWPLGTTSCHRCGAPLCQGCVPEHRCPSPDQVAELQTLRQRFDERMSPQGRA